MLAGQANPDRKIALHISCDGSFIPAKYVAALRVALEANDYQFATMLRLPVVVGTQRSVGAVVHIVAVDPSRTTLKALSRVLQVYGHVVHPFLDGQAALDFINADLAVDVLITSGELGAMSGLELCWETRLLCGRDRSIYIMLMSSNSDPKQIVSTLDSGADEFMSKPPVTEELYARLRSAERQLSLQRELIRLAMIDPLTGVCNRRAFFEKATPACGSERNTPLATIMFDVDHFKRVNDTYGHDTGDKVLRSIGESMLSEQVLVGRLGGEEFAILLDGVDCQVAAKYAECLRAKLAALGYATTHGNMSVTCSFGVAEWQSGDTIDQLLQRADGALYTAKNAGRNRVVIASSADLAAEGWSELVRSRARDAPDGPGTQQPLRLESDAA
jgi:two-component system cell cycle response regulator